jgi:uncharacterized membrane protein
MEALFAVYDTHQDALNALAELKENDFPMKQVSLLGKAEVIDDHLHLRSHDKASNAPVLLGTGGGILVGLLTGVGVFAIPGFGFLYGAGAVVGTLAGFDVGLIAGGVGSLLTSLGVKEIHHDKIHEHLVKGKYTILVHGDAGELEKAKEVLERAGGYHEIVKSE